MLDSKVSLYFVFPKLFYSHWNDVCGDGNTNHNIRIGKRALCFDRRCKRFFAFKWVEYTTNDTKLKVATKHFWSGKSASEMANFYAKLKQTIRDCDILFVEPLSYMKHFDGSQCKDKSATQKQLLLCTIVSSVSFCLVFIVNNPKKII